MVVTAVSHMRRDRPPNDDRIDRTAAEIEVRQAMGSSSTRLTQFEGIDEIKNQLPCLA
jgi:hypothetical protein